MKIGILDHMGYGNLGDAATQDVVIANILKRVPNADIVGFSLVPHDTVRRHGIPCHPLRWSCPVLDNPEAQPTTGNDKKFNSSLKSALKSSSLVYPWAKPLADIVRKAIFWVRSYRRLRSLDLLLISGGGQLDELWHGPWSHPYTVFKFSLLARLARKKVYLLNVGVGPLEHRLSRFFARWAVRFATYRSFRDLDSQARVCNLGVKAPTHVYPDVVYALQVADAVKSVPGSPRRIVGLNPIGYCDPRLWPRRNFAVYDEYLEKLVCFSLWLLEHGYDLRVFTTENSVDRHAIQDLKTRLQSRVSSPAVTDQIFRAPSESVKDVLKEMSEFDVVVTSKFHGIIFSHLLRKPVISLSYHRKMDVAMRSVNQSHLCEDIEHFGVDWLIQALCSIVGESESLELKYSVAVETKAATLSQQFDDLFLVDKSYAVSPQRFPSQIVKFRTGESK